MLHIWYSEKAPYSCPVLPPLDTPSCDHCLRRATALETFMCFSTATFMRRSWAHILFQTTECLYWQSELACFGGFDLPSIPLTTPAPVLYCGPSMGVLLEQLKYHRLGTANPTHPKIHCVTSAKTNKKPHTTTHNTGQLSLSDVHKSALPSQEL